MTNIVLMSDDGVDAVGFIILYELVKNYWPMANIVGVAPAKPCSGLSTSITPTMGKTLPHVKVERVVSDKDLFAVSGTPMDALYCVFLQPTEYFSHGFPDFLISGINAGANVGVEVVHSGTVAPV